MQLIVNGVDFMPYLAFQGFKRDRRDIESSNAGITLDGIKHRGRIAVKRDLTLTFRALKASELSIVESAVLPETFTVVVDDEVFGRVSYEMYCATTSHNFCVEKAGETWYMGEAFKLVEV